MDASIYKVSLLFTMTILFTFHVFVPLRLHTQCNHQTVLKNRLRKVNENIRCSVARRHTQVLYSLMYVVRSTNTISWNFFIRNGSNRNQRCMQLHFAPSHTKKRNRYCSFPWFNQTYTNLHTFIYNCEKLLDVSLKY